MITVPFNLENALAELPLACKNGTSQYDALVQSLKSGKAREVTLIVNDVQIKYMLEAAPIRKTIDVLDRKGNLIDTNKLLFKQASRFIQQIAEKQNLEVIDMGQARSVKVR